MAKKSDKLAELEKNVNNIANMLQMHHEFIQLLIQQDVAKLQALGVLPPPPQPEDKKEEK